MTALGPTLTQFDQRVLEAVPAGRGARVRRIVEDVQRAYPQRLGVKVWHPTHADVVGVLRGLEHLGLIRKRNGWWRR